MSFWKSPGFYFVSTIIRLLRHKFFYGQQGETFWKSVQRGRSPRGSRPNAFRRAVQMLQGLKFHEETIGNIPCFFLEPVKKRNSDEKTGMKTVLYIHGGGYVNEALDAHWHFVGRAMLRTGVRIVFPQYSLAPEFTCEDALPELLHTYEEILKNVPPEKIFVMGDSAGGGLALSLLQDLREHALPQPRHAILISPSVELGVPDLETDAQARALEEKDIMLSFRSFSTLRNRWRGTLPETDWRVQPFYGSLEGLAPAVLFTGTADILNCCAHRFQKKAREENYPLEFCEYPEMFHCWLLLPIPESWKPRKRIYEILREI